MQGDDIRPAEKVLYFELITEVQTMEGSRELIEQLRHRGHTVVLASSTKADEVFAWSAHPCRGDGGLTVGDPAVVRR